VKMDAVLCIVEYDQRREMGSGHLKVRRGRLSSVLPMHGKSQELGTGLVNAIKKQLGLK